MDESLYDVRTRAPGPDGALPITGDMLLHRPSGDLFGLTQNAGMGWAPERAGADAYLILSTQGGLRAEDGTPIALGLHTGHWELGLLVRECAGAIAAAGGAPFAACVSDPCDGRTQGTPGMMDSLPYRNDAAVVLGRLARSLPTARGVVGVATCDKGLPAMLMAVAALGEMPGVVAPGGVTLPPERGEDAGKVQTIGARYAHGLLTLEEAAELGCRACGSPGGGCQFLGTAASAQVVAEALGLAPTHSALAPSGQAIWRDVARRAAECVVEMRRRGIGVRDILTEAAVRNALLAHAAFGGSTNLLLHLPAIAHAAGLRRPAIEDWEWASAATPRIVDALPNGPAGHPTVRVFLAGGVPEVLLHLRRIGVLETDALTVTGRTVGEELDAWERSERRARLRDRLRGSDGVDPDDVILSVAAARAAGLSSAMCFPRGNLAPEGSVIKSTALDPEVVGADGVYRFRGPARVFAREEDAVAAIKRTGGGRQVAPGDVVVVAGRGPRGAGMEEIYQVTSALRHLPWGREVAVLTDARFSGVSTGACVGHISPEALAGGPLGRLRDGDLVEIVVDTRRLRGSVDLVGAGGCVFGPDEGARVLAARSPNPDISPDPRLPAATRLWAAMQEAGGGVWGGCVYDVEAIIRRLEAAR